MELPHQYWWGSFFVGRVGILGNLLEQKMTNSKAKFASFFLYS
jgi:hypothetical protein